MKVKICGVCSPHDATLVAQAGADYIGVILARKGPRQQTVEQASAIFDAAPHVRRVGVFANQSVADVAAAARQLQLTVVQLHGNESADAVAEIQREVGAEVWKTITPENIVAAVENYVGVVQGVLLDNPNGGSGRTFDWELARNARQLLPAHVKLVVAGGLRADNVQEAIKALNPDVVDVSSGVEKNMGEKSREQVFAFVRNART